ncbi:MAG: hypothetical protein MJE66_05295 [Proteobacteria bacterium]|nr:hypothetical protein [Pseudomonadota bacterium]
MSATAVFDNACSQLEERTSLDRLEARGTVRLALKTAGLEPGKVTKEQMLTVLERVLPGELESRGIDQAESICSTIGNDLPDTAATDVESPEAVFARLGGS